MARLHALLVEAPFRSLMPLRTALHALGTATTTATSHHEAVKIASQQKLDGAFVDGSWLRSEQNPLKALRQTPSNAGMPITIVLDAADGALAALATDATQVLYRPCTSDELWEVTRRSHALMEVEHRRYQRLPLAVPVFVVWGDERRQYGHSVNLSANGMLLALHPQPPVGTLITLAFGFNGLQQDFIVRGNVIRADDKGRLGVQFRWHSDERARELNDTLAKKAIAF